MKVTCCRCNYCNAGSQPWCIRWYTHKTWEGILSKWNVSADSEDAIAEQIYKLTRKLLLETAGLCRCRFCHFFERGEFGGLYKFLNRKQMLNIKQFEIRSNLSPIFAFIDIAEVIRPKFYLNTSCKWLDWKKHSIQTALNNFCFKLTVSGVGIIC